jgi:hypothetical protein
LSGVGDDSEDGIYSLLSSSFHPTGAGAGIVGSVDERRRLPRMKRQSSLLKKFSNIPGKESSVMPAEKKKEVMSQNSQQTTNMPKVLEVYVSSLLRCAEACLRETAFPCLSANFDRVSLL